ncbi:ATP-binding protein (plasmid) [Azospirillum argentinense]|uniref:ATP-binding protein n=2 Tax=Azospirillum argentinense TaxID=2970906 RepID=A0A4D8PSM0_9PROT|nr:ATP-binding protein [Azospirillum argentinense]
MAQALRGVGYSLASAIADLVDNSVAAGARNIWIDFHWAGRESWVRVMDDGSGMDEDELFQAMRLGTKNALSQREPKDLGRFGLGLKTASFAQCTRLTVASSKAAKLAVWRWDLDHIARVGDWHLLKGAASGSDTLFEPIRHQDMGTLVLWENLDRVPGVEVYSSKRGEDAFLRAIDDVEAHLAMVFHRYLEGSPPALRLFINGCDERARVQPWDPFLSGHPATLHRPTERIDTRCGLVEVKGFVLPHKDRLDGEQYKDAGGPRGWTAQQGFYVYRNRRLLVAGSWLGLGRPRAWTKEEVHKLARLRIDIPNSADAEWGIDIKKSVARPPTELRPRLTALAEDARTLARRVFVHRGRYGPAEASPNVARVWRSVEKGKSVAYRVDRNHPAVREVLEQAGGLGPSVERMLRIIEETVPFQRIWLDTVEKTDLQPGGFENAPSGEVRALVEVLYRDLRSRIGLTAATAKAQLLNTEPFNRYPELVKGLPDNTGGDA